MAESRISLMRLPSVSSGASASTAESRISLIRFPSVSSTSLVVGFFVVGFFVMVPAPNAVGRPLGVAAPWTLCPVFIMGGGPPGDVRSKDLANVSFVRHPMPLSHGHRLLDD